MTALSLSFLSLFHTNKQGKIIFLPFSFPLIFLSSKHTYGKYKSTLFLSTQFFPLNFLPSNFFPPIQTKPKWFHLKWTILGRSSSTIVSQLWQNHFLKIKFFTFIINHDFEKVKNGEVFLRGMAVAGPWDSRWELVIRVDEGRVEMELKKKGG